MEISNFYSWQGDLDKNLNRYFLRDCIKDSIKQVNNKINSNLGQYDLERILVFDQATKRTRGSIDIAGSVFSKIDKCSTFFCDISIVKRSKKRKYPNPNVLIELGYASSIVGWENIIMIFNESTGKVEELPFDIRNRRVLRYTLSKKKSVQNRKTQKDRLKKTLSSVLYEQASLSNPIENDPILKILVYIGNRIVDILKKWRILINQLYTTIGAVKPVTFTHKDLERICEQINPKTKPQGVHTSQHRTWYDYIAYLSALTNKKISEIFIFQEKLDFELIGLLSKADNEISNDDLYNINKSILANNEMSHLAHSIYSLELYLNAANRRFHEVYKEHTTEYHRQYAHQQRKIESIIPSSE